MALNYLLHRHQISLVRARDAASAEGRIVHRKFAELYALRISAMSAASGGDLIVPTDPDF